MNHVESHSTSLAIVGMAGRFPRAGNIAEFWRNLCAGEDCISFFSDEELATSGINVAPEDSNYVKARGILAAADLFDAAFFDIKPKEAEVMDPQHRVFLECAWEALEHAGYDATKYDGNIGVFAGMSQNTYLMNNVATRPDVLGVVGEYQAMLGNDKDYLPTRVSYKLNLTGPSLNIQTACSTSLVAVCVACQHLLTLQCGIALAGGVSIRFPQRQGHRHQTGGITSRDGHCRPFDAAASGTVAGEGVGIVVLKRLDDAWRDGDTIYAVIKGFATNNDGAEKIGYTAPSVHGQAEVIATAQAIAGVAPEEISYVEAHGTATPLGDPIEIEALKKAFFTESNPRNWCAIGSVKSNIGHLDAAAGIAGLIKTTLALYHRKIPASLHFKTPNPEIDFADSPFFVNDRLRDWGSDGKPRRAGVSSFGIGGTNAHVVLEEAPEIPVSENMQPPELLVLSAKTAAALDAMAINLAAHLKQQPEPNLADVAHTLRVGRREFAHRRILVADSSADAARVLNSGDVKRMFSHVTGNVGASVVFMFPGQGAQRVNMGRELYETEPVFREELDACLEILKPKLKHDLRSILFPEPDSAAEAVARLMQTSLTQPALFAVEYALARLWMSWGVQPAALIGHSIGEYVAACLAGVFSLADALELVAERGRLMQQQPAGEMLAVRMSEADAQQFLSAEIALAAVNAPERCVLSGSTQAIAQVEKQLAEQNIASQRLRTSHAFHSPLMDGAMPEFVERVKAIRLHEPEIPFGSNVSGTWITAAEATDPNYWARHLRQTVRFSDGVAELLQDSERVFIEIGPGQTLSQFVKQQATRDQAVKVIAPLARGGGEISERQALLFALGQAWACGATVDWLPFSSEESRRRVPLPTYPFQRTRFFVTPSKVMAATAPATDRTNFEARSGNEDQVATNRASNGDLHSVALPKTSRETDSRQQRVARELRGLLSELSGLDLTSLNGETFAELGFDSLFLTQVSLAIERRLHVRVAFRELLEDYATVDALAAHLLEELPEEKREATNGKISESRAASELVATDANGLPLTAAQRELWFASQVSDAASCVFNECRLLRLLGSLEVAVLQKALEELGARHEALRTTFAADGSRQFIHPEFKLQFEQIDLSASPADQAERIDTIQLEEARTPFDLVHGPLIRARLIRCGAEEHVLVVAVHHLICDGQSFALLLRELDALYRAKGNAAAARLPAAVRFSDYVQEKIRATNDHVQAEAYWSMEFAEIPPPLDLPTDAPRSTQWNFEGARQTVLLAESLTDAVKQLSARCGCTLFTTLLAGWSVVLCRLSGQSEIVIGIPVADRGRAGGEQLIGHCVNFVPVRAQVADSASFVDCLAMLQRKFLDAHEHQHFTFGSLLQKLNVPREVGRLPLVSVTLNVERREDALDFGGLAVELSANPHSYINFDLNLSATEERGRLRLECHYNARLFNADTIRRWLRHFETVLNAITREPKQCVGDISLLRDEERQQMLREWNDTETPYRRDVTVSELVAKQVMRTPQAMALRFGNEQMTYCELQQRVSALAQRLRCAGAAPQTRVGICADRSLEMVVGLLAILETGAAYVPLDPTYPRARLAYMLRDSGCTVLLKQEQLWQELELDVSQLRVLCLDAAIEAIETAMDARAVVAAASAEDLAYVIYTSGSTGQPKGVAIRHRNIANLFAGMDGLLGEQRGVWLAVTSISFDISVVELFWTLARGFTVVIQPETERAEDDAHPAWRTVAENIWREGVTHLQCTPSLAKTLVETPEGRAALRQLKQILVGGEALPAALAEQLCELGPQVFNMYGPTETTVWSAAYEVKSSRNPVPIGRPLANTQIYILDTQRRPVPIGVPGELYIGGEGLAQGYLNGPELTEEKFVPDPFSADAEARMYRTGDSARFRADGVIEFLGRLDQQVKVRGHRIELGEIETALSQISQVQDCVVVVRETNGDQQLEAYLISEESRLAPSENELRQSLSRRLPRYMIPASFTYLKSFPLTPNGKVDRRALSRVERKRPGEINDFQKPETLAEQAVARIWQELLGVKELGTRDNFFELGGHSLMMMQVLARLRAQFQINITMREFFQKPTIAGLAEALEDCLTDEISQLTEAEAQSLVGASK